MSSDVRCTICGSIADASGLCDEHKYDEQPATLSPLDEKFWAFHNANPQVYLQIEKYAQRAYRHGIRKIGMKMIFELLRWDMLFSTNSEDYKLNNSYTSRYTRILLEKHPEFSDMFEIRGIHS